MSSVGGDSALEEGNFLTRYANAVTVVHRREELRAGPILQKRAIDNPKIDFIWDTVITDIIGNGEVENVKLENRKSGKSWEHAIDGVFIFIGHTPNTEIFKGQLDMDEGGYIAVNRFTETTSQVYLPQAKPRIPTFAR